ncbi:MULTISPECIES: PD-(D/E)XK nuclease family protein [unclassified Prochlorococcus]|uniref:PD-(D/E)XK nuclease family protein n=1 Tax=unclassified Prochlorococcus TaxID=2627481 RepID=UPI0005338CA1|nr:MULTISPECIES: PD-(D/E)XK nuclease family protein [unclassified Prochlorococcus]KGG14852.1 hypothetical protein EV06_1915 [Prochlorococcus sp. MIT 0602]KGG15715.1 hypothetical protein EV07_1680 [Prochlorococcus sp. MIT 0603]
MIDLKRNGKKEPVKATGVRSRESSSYTPNQKEDFKISRGRFSNFLTCQRCFYLDRVMGLDPPGTPGWTLNETTDLLLKKEFDECRETHTAHRLFAPNGLSHVIPFDHPEMDNWRDSLHYGLMLRYKTSSIILTGGVDDIWQNTNTQQLIIVDYKSQAKNARVDKQDYLDDPYHEGYKIQMDFYAYLLSGMGFDVHPTSYFLVCNAKRDEDGFHKTMNFDEYLVPYKWNSNWIESKVDEMITLMNQYEIPEANACCKNCAYSDQYAKAVHPEGLKRGQSIQRSLFY